MTVAAAYARFSSDSQRDESIEIQLEAITRFVESRGWTLGDSYTDYAISGTREDRPSFNRCVADALEGRFDVLVVLKIDRFARNVIFAQETKRKLFAAGVELWSVREGQVDNTPEGFLKGGINDLFAEYYSRNLAVTVKGGIRKSAEQLKSAGRRIYGYTQDERDRFIVDPARAEVVRSMFEDYVAGRTMREICDALNERGIRNIRGNTWKITTLGNILKNPAYKGLYVYDGVVEDGAIPAIVDGRLWDDAQAIRARRVNSKRRKVVNDYLLTDKVWCLRCGKPMCGTAGTGRSGKKYTYYGCVNRGGCGLRVPSGAVEDTVASVVVSAISDPETLDAIAADMVEYGRTLERHAGAWVAERSEAERRRDNYIRAIGEGAPYQSVAKPLQEAEERISELDRLIAEEEAELDQYADMDSARDFLERTMRGAADDDDFARVLMGVLVERIYVDKERVCIAFNLSETPDGDPFEYDIDEVKGIANGAETRKPLRTWPLLGSESAQKNSEPAGRQRVRMSEEWSAKLYPLRTVLDGRYILVWPMDPAA